MSKLLPILRRYLPWVLIAMLTWIAWVEHQKANQARMQTGWIKQVNDSTLAQVAAITAERDALLALKDAAQTLKGTLVAGVKIRTPAETLSKPKEVIESTVTVDSARFAVVEDSTRSGIRLRIEAEAPPFPAPMKIGYDLRVPEFSPEVGFVRVGDQYTAVVSWAGQTFEVENAMYVPPTKQLPSWTLYAEGSARVLEGWRAPEWRLGVSRRLTERSTLEVATGMEGLLNDPHLKVLYRRTLWSH